MVHALIYYAQLALELFIPLFTKPDELARSFMNDGVVRTAIVIVVANLIYPGLRWIRGFARSKLA